jgi:ABC-type transport system substrate-binding protein
VTKALRLLIDHEEAMTAWAEVWFGRGYVTSYLCATLADWDFSEQEYTSRFLEWKRPKDEAAREALRLLAAAGFTRENPLKFRLTGYGTGSFSQAYDEMLDGQYRRLGGGVVQPELRLLDNATLNTVMARGDFEFALRGSVPAQPFDPDDFFQTFHHTNGGRNYGKYSDQTLDRMIERQRTIFNAQQRKTAVKEVLTYLIENAPHVGWCGRYTPNAFQSPVKDWAPEAPSAVWGNQYEHVWLDT